MSWAASGCGRSHDVEAPERVPVLELTVGYPDLLPLPSARWVWGENQRKSRWDHSEPKSTYTSHISGFNTNPKGG